MSASCIRFGSPVHINETIHLCDWNSSATGKYRFIVVNAHVAAGQCWVVFVFILFFYTTEGRYLFGSSQWSPHDRGRGVRVFPRTKTTWQPLLRFLWTVPSPAWPSAQCPPPAAHRRAASAPAAGRRWCPTSATTRLFLRIRSTSCKFTNWQPLDNKTSNLIPTRYAPLKSHSLHSPCCKNRFLLRVKWGVNPLT